MKFIAILLFVVFASPTALWAAEKPTAPPITMAPITLTPITMEQLLQDLRDMDSSTEMDGDHVVGEHMC
mgnify:CR=1 FL=1